MIAPSSVARAAFVLSMLLGIARSAPAQGPRLASSLAVTPTDSAAASPSSPALAPRSLVPARGGGNYAGTGALIGAVTAVTYVMLEIKSCERHDTHPSDGPPCSLGIIMLPPIAIGGTILGALAGTMIPSHGSPPSP
jgi:hypothetical protein